MTQHLPPSQPVWPLVIDQPWWVWSKFSDTNFASTNQVWIRPFSCFGSFQPGFIKRLDRPKMKVSIPRRRFELICVQTNGGHAIYTTGVQKYVWIQPKENETGSWREPHISKRRLYTKLQFKLCRRLLPFARVERILKDFWFCALVRSLTQGVHLYWESNSGQKK